MVDHHFYKRIAIFGDTISYRSPKNSHSTNPFLPWKQTIVYTVLLSSLACPCILSVGVRRRSPSEPHNTCVLQSSDSGHAGAADWNSRSEEFARQISFLHESLGLSEEASRSWSRHSSQVPRFNWFKCQAACGGWAQQVKWHSKGFSRSKGGHSEEPCKPVPKQCKSGAEAVEKRAKICCKSLDIRTNLERYRKRLLQSAGANESSGVSVLQSMSWIASDASVVTKLVHFWIV